MFLHTHPYEPFIPEKADRLIVGTLPPPRFTTGELLPGDVDFCYGSRDGLLWPVLERIFSTQLRYENSSEAAEQRKTFLINHGIGVFDMVESARRERIDASDLGMKTPVLRDITGKLPEMPNVRVLLFTGGNSKNGPEYLFRKHAREKGIAIEVVSDEVPRIHRFTLINKTYYTVSLTAPSGSANRAIGGMDAYKMRKAQDPDYTTMDFRVQQYAPFFREKFYDDL
ncbi:uracil-DNA glycosylase family protein [Robertkochia marina]|uniref:Uracil-DNA glycosylase family protein n=1 Tax=Robertkochia marina TaxID=1227945 RepID=A0A4S3LXU2_9FLAO|nr:uracil-DNA glycosylase family protein [Robertkochia marina]THD66390.1 uracil-DNA glycosylase family protein [Robertkochia marina]TRZ44069.1 uracil-DNA glycosylase family protein [Robertkochia marina]